MGILLKPFLSIVGILVGEATNLAYRWYQHRCFFGGGLLD